MVSSGTEINLFWLRNVAKVYLLNWQSSSCWLHKELDSYMYKEITGCCESLYNQWNLRLSNYKSVVDKIFSSLKTTHKYIICDITNHHNNSTML